MTADQRMLLREIKQAIAEGDYSPVSDDESNFISKMEQAAKNDWTLSDKQDKWLEDIWKRAKGY